MYLKEIQIQNFRCFEDSTLKFKNGINLIIGDNGVGKTTILEAAVVGLGACFQDISIASSVSIKKEDVRQELIIIDDSPQKVYHSPTRIFCEMDAEDQSYQWSRIRKDESANTRMSTDYPNKKAKISDYFRVTSNDLTSKLPVLNYQSIYRVMLSKRSDFASSSKKLDDRRCGYTGCLDSALDNKFIRKWCYAMERKRTPNRRYELFKESVSTFMKTLNEEEPSQILFFSEEFEDFVYSSGENTLPISFLSSGYQSALWLVMDIAFRGLQLNPGANAWEDISGVVLIDEIDKHLHPKWQWKVLDALKTTFPGIQFIITTHAPIVISSCKDAHLIRIDNNHKVTYPASAFAYSIDDVAEYTQGSLGIPSKLHEMYEGFEEAFRRNDREKAYVIYSSMLDYYGENNTLVKKCRTKMKLMRR